jgi:hypothetical protein
MVLFSQKTEVAFWSGVLIGSRKILVRPLIEILGGIEIENEAFYLITIEGSIN